MHGMGSYVTGSPLPGASARQGRNVEIKAVDNGWLVTIQNPLDHEDPTMLGVSAGLRAMVQAVSEINKAGGAGLVQGMDEELDDYKKNDEDRAKRQELIMKKTQENIDKAMKAPKKRRAFECYVFLDKAKLISFLSELLVIETPEDPFKQLNT
jgi:hypothetical protein